MNSYKVIKVVNFPEIAVNKYVSTIVPGTLPGTTKEPMTKITHINTDYIGYDYYLIDHEMMIKESGIAFGYLEGVPQSMEFFNYLKKYKVECFLAKSKDYAYLSAPSFVTNDLSRLMSKNNDLQTEIEEIELNMSLLKEHATDYLGAWFKKVSTRISSSALFGSDLINDPLYEQLLHDGAMLSSVYIPYKDVTIHLNNKSGVSSRYNFTNTADEIYLIDSLKSDIIDKIKN